jgi:hypothetical protein
VLDTPAFPRALHDARLDVVALREREKFFSGERTSVLAKRVARQQRFFLPVSPQEFGMTQTSEKIFLHLKRL